MTVRKRFLDGKRPLAFAHRGGSALWPENTLEAFRGAIGTGLHYIETDVHRTRDGAIVIHHDSTLDRTTDGTGPIKERTLAELQTLDAGYWFTTDGRTYPYRGKGLRIPTFEEALELGDDIHFNVELKQREPSMVNEFWQLIQEHGLEDRVLVAAEQDPIAKAFRDISRGRVATSASKREVTWFWGAVRARLSRWVNPPFDALQVPVRSGPLTVVEPRFIEAAHRAGVQVHVWTIDEEPEMRRLLELGVDGLMTDRPDRLKSVVDSV